MIKEFFKTRTISFYLRIALIILLIAPIVYTGGLVGTVKEYPAAIAFMVISIAVQIVLMFLPENHFTDYIALAGIIFLALAFSFFALGGVLSVADYIAGVHFWGDSTQFSNIMIYGSLLICSSGLGIASCYIK